MAINSFMLSMGNVLGTCSDPFSVLNLTNSKWFRLVSRFCKQMKSKFSRICMVVLSQPEVWAGSRQLQRNTWMYRHFNSKVFKVSVAKRNCCNATWWLHGAPKKKRFSSRCLWKHHMAPSHTGNCCMCMGGRRRAPLASQLRDYWLPIYGGRILNLVSHTLFHPPPRSGVISQSSPWWGGKYTSAMKKPLTS